MTRTDMIVGSTALIGVLLVSGITYYWLQEPKQPEATTETGMPSLEMRLSSNANDGFIKAGLIRGTGVLVPQDSTSSLRADNSPELPKDSESAGVAPTLADVHFDFDHRGLPEEAKAVLRGHAEVLRDSHWSVLIQGHTDDRGPVKHNLRLGLRRAERVKEHLISLGVSPSQIETVSLGEFDPVCVEANEACRRQNRRVHFSLAKLETLPRDSMDASATSFVFPKITPESGGNSFAHTTIPASTESVSTFEHNEFQPLEASEMISTHDNIQETSLLRGTPDIEYDHAQDSPEALNGHQGTPNEHAGSPSIGVHQSPAHTTSQFFPPIP